MAIPDFQSLMLPLLRFPGDGKEHPNPETTERLAAEFQLTEDERLQLLPRGKQSIFTDRVAWAKSHFKRAGLIESTGWGVFRITELGKSVPAKTPVRIDLKFLDQ